MTRARLVSLVLLLLWPRTGLAQDFVPPTPLWPVHGASELLEHGWPALGTQFSFEAQATRWFDLPDLTTHALAVGRGWRTLRAAAGVSQTGAPELGWTAGAAGVGAATARGGAGVRALARRDRTDGFAFAARPGQAGVEIGAGGWLAAGEGLCLWASVPQLWTAGAAPPLRRSLAIGGTANLGELEVWLSRSAVPGLVRGLRGEHSGGVAFATRPLAIWLEAQDQPLRGGFGIAARTRGLCVTGSVLGHPVLGETFRLGIGVGGGR